MSSPIQTSPSPVEKKEKKTGSVAFILSLLFHGGILLMIGGIVLIPAVVQKSAFTADPNMVVPTDIQMDEPPDAAQEQNDLPPSQAPHENMQLSEQPAPAAQNDLFVAREDTGASASSWAGLAASAPVALKQPKIKDESPLEEEAQKQKKMSVGSRVTLFGSTDKDNSGHLVGYLYDLKQTDKRKPTEMARSGPEDIRSKQSALYAKSVGEFVSSGFRDSMLKKYFRAPDPLYLSNLCIPLISEEESTRAFNVEKEVDPCRFFIHYRGNITPPETGRYRFWGYGCHLLSVAIDGRGVLNAGSLGIETKDAPVNWAGERKNIGNGPWKFLDKDKTYRIDIIIGDTVGTVSAFMMVEKEGEKYEMDAKTGIPVLPIFKVNPSPLKLNKEDTRKIGFKFLSKGIVFQAQ